MPNKYIDSVDRIQSKYPHFIPSERGKTRNRHGHEYTEIGICTKSHGTGWQLGRTTGALATTGLSLLIVPLAFKKYRNLIGRLWKEGSSGSEKISLYFNNDGDKASLQSYLDKKKEMQASMEAHFKQPASSQTQAAIHPTSVYHEYIYRPSPVIIRAPIFPRIYSRPIHPLQRSLHHHVPLHRPLRTHHHHHGHAGRRRF
jgi:hypothetical protein